MWEKLNQREKILLTLVSIFLFILFLFFIYKFISKRKLELEQNLQKTRRELQTLISLKETINSIPQVPNIPSRNEFLSLITTRLQEHKLNPSNIRDREEQIGKNQNKVIFIELSFNGVLLEQLLPFIHQIENEQKGIKVKELLIRKPLPGRDIFDIRLSLYVEKFD